MFPPGLLLTAIYRRISWHARLLRSYWDLSTLPLTYLKEEEHTTTLVNGEKYGFIIANDLASKANLAKEQEDDIPFITTDYHENKNNWHLFGVLDSKSTLPVRSKDPFVSYGLLQDDPKKLARSFAIKAYSLETLAWLILLSGLAVNIIFIIMIITSIGH